MDYDLYTELQDKRRDLKLELRLIDAQIERKYSTPQAGY